MFKLSVKVEYGILAVLALSLYEERANVLFSAPLSARSIAEKEEISIRFLEQAMTALKERGIIESVRGPHGGYRLARPSKEITLFDIILAIEGQSVPRETSMISSKIRILNEIVEGVDTALENHLDAIDFESLLRRARALEEKEALMFHI